MLIETVTNTNPPTEQSRFGATSAVGAVIFGHFCTSGHYWRGPTIALKLGNICLRVPLDG